MKWICFSEGWHPYQEQFARAMRPHGVEVSPGKNFSNRSLLEQADAVDGVHFHWVENLWGCADPFRRARLLYGVYSYCRLAKRLGKRIIWTVHNHVRHEGRQWGDRFGFSTIASSADLIIVHSRWSESVVREEYRPSGRLVVMPIGNFDYLYPARTGPVIPEPYAVPLFGLIGAIRPYRGIEVAIAATRRLEGFARLRIAGGAIDAAYVHRLEALVDDCPWISFQPGGLTDAEYAEQVRDCDAILLPYRGITGSAALLAAWTMSRPVIVADLPFFREFVSDGPAGRLLKGITVECLGQEMMALMTVPRADREIAARAEADKYAWDDVVRPVAAAVAGWRHCTLLPV